MIDFILNPWPWWFSGLVISCVMFLLIFFGKSFGFSANLRTMCAIGGAGKKVKFFDFDWKKQIWNLVFLLGAILGGYLTNTFLTYPDQAVEISENTIRDLKALGFSAPTTIQPKELFSLESLFTLKGFLILAIGGFLVGFGARYAGGCTSGHAISGIADLQVPSMIAVVGFFIGGFIMTFGIFPLLFS
ncbi:YeeE/YedE family protein [Brumimicrobium aurantiacum]|uniref:YeeE/YedE family protein n=1 Tax=Brumimicrobium aurantiacum TaxID=1737063 RepID=A0A3E1EYD4_9FLAO|nr:YeeE/YedE thiosulfate transporter family protein [Brumimicrobium aurantiacum]RFC54571.1 YeeE/YedE family protein [Brumimicrobium aurantiacum]